MLLRSPELAKSAGIVEGMGFFRFRFVDANGDEHLTATEGLQVSSWHTALLFSAIFAIFLDSLACRATLLRRYFELSLSVAMVKCR